MNPFRTLPKVRYEGPDTKNDLAFRYYNPDELVEGKPMREHLRFSAAFWHCMRNTLSDPFGVGTAFMPWDDESNTLDNAIRRAEVFFDFLDLLGIEYYCFHDRDVAPEGTTVSESIENLETVVKALQRLQNDRGKKLLWGTACLFSHPRYAQGAATSPNANVFTYAASQVKNAIDATQALGGQGYVFWGGREGYTTLLNTNMKRELDHLGRFLHLAVEYKKLIGFEGQFFIEPKPKEPTTHQYDSDAAACLNFLREYGLFDDFELNIETNHAQLAGHTMWHELQVAANAGKLGSIDANQGNPYLGWDTDEFPTDLPMATQIMLTVLGMGGFRKGGLNFDAKRRRDSYEPLDLVYGHIAGMDTFARALKIAAKIRKDGTLEKMVRQRYSSWDVGIGAEIEAGKVTLKELDAYARRCPEPELPSARQEMFEVIWSRYF
ncbi:MAG: xylose isomerase [Chthoniobacterales bacterium]|nr:xylose isomerase [Chthoniobacterales bacterium]